MHGGAESLLLSSAGMAGVSEHLQSVSEFIQVWSASSSTPATVTVSLYTHTHTRASRVPYWKETVSHTEHEPSVFPILVPCECSCFKIMRHHLQLFLPCWLEENLGLVYTLPPTLWISMHPHRSLSGCLACSSRLITVLILNESLITRPAQN